MRTSLPIVWLLARVVLGTMEVENNFSDVARSRNERDDKLENETDKLGPTTSDLFKDLNGDSFTMETDRKEVDPGGVIKDESNVKMADYFKIIIKRGQEPSESLLDTNEKGSSQEKKDPWAFWWGGKRINANGQTPGIRRPIRVPFSSWGGKRGTLPFDSWSGKRGRLPFNNWFGKRGKLAFGSWNGKRGREMYSESGQVADNLWHTPFYNWAGKRSGEPFRSWGGKRAQSENDRESNEDGDQGDRENSSHMHQILGIVTDGFPKEDKERFQVGQNAIRGEIEMGAINDGSDGKHNNIAYRIPTENIGNWFVQMCRLLANRKAQHEHTKAVSFLPWYGKKSDNAFSPWGG